MLQKPLFFAKNKSAGRQIHLEVGTQYASAVGTMSTVHHLAFPVRHFSFKMGFSHPTSDFRKKEKNGNLMRRVTGVALDHVPASSSHDHRLPEFSFCFECVFAGKETILGQCLDNGFYCKMLSGSIQESAEKN